MHEPSGLLIRLTFCPKLFVQRVRSNSELKHIDCSLQSEDISLDLRVPSLPGLDLSDDSHSAGVEHQRSGSRRAPWERERVTNTHVMFHSYQSNPNGVPQRGHTESRWGPTRDTMWNPFRVRVGVVCSVPRVCLLGPQGAPSATLGFVVRPLRGQDTHPSSTQVPEERLRAPRRASGGRVPAREPPGRPGSP